MPANKPDRSGRLQSGFKFKGYQPYRAFRPVRDIQRSSTTRAHCSATWRNAAETGFCPGSSRATGRPSSPPERVEISSGILPSRGTPQFGRFPFAASFAKDMVNLAVGGALEITHVFYNSQNRDIHHLCHIDRFPPTIIDTSSWGEVTMTIPSRGRDWNTVKGTSPVPGGISTNI